MYISRQFHSLFSYFSAKKKDLLCFWSFLVALTMGYKIIHFPNSENIGHLRNTQAHYSWVIIFCFFGCYSADFDQKTTICVKTNDILESPSKTESTNVCFKRFRELFSPKNSPLRTPLVGHGMTHLQYFDYKWSRIVQKRYILLPKDSL